MKTKTSRRLGERSGPKDALTQTATFDDGTFIFACSKLDTRKKRLDDRRAMRIMHETDDGA